MLWKQRFWKWLMFLRMLWLPIREVSVIDGQNKECGSWSGEQELLVAEEALTLIWPLNSKKFRWKSQTDLEWALKLGKGCQLQQKKRKWQHCLFHLFCMLATETGNTENKALCSALLELVKGPILRSVEIISMIFNHLTLSMISKETRQLKTACMHFLNTRDQAWKSFCYLQ